MKLSTGIVYAILTLSCLTASAEDVKRPVPKGYEGIVESTPPEKMDWENIVEKRSVIPYVDANGTPVELYVCAKVGLSKVLSPIAAEDFAFKKAELSAKSTLAKWLNEKITYKMVGETKRLILLKNGEEKEGQEIESQNEQWKQETTAILRGMTVYKHKRKDGVYFVVWRWSKKGVQLSEEVKNINAGQKVPSNTHSRVKEFDWN